MAKTLDSKINIKKLLLSAIEKKVAIRAKKNKKD